MRHLIRTLIVDDSALVRQHLLTMLRAAGGFDVVDTVPDGALAVERAVELDPDLILMDIHLPKLDGVEATRRIMARRPTSIVVVAASAEREGATAFEAVEAGALAVLSRPKGPGQPGHLRRRREFLTELRAFARRPVLPARRLATDSDRVPAKPRATSSPARRVPAEVIAIAASTGGPAALRAILQGLPRRELPAILIVQHIADGFIAGLADWLSAVAPAPVVVATDRLPVRPGLITVGAEDRHLEVGDGLIRLTRTPAIGGHRPSATRLFESVAKEYGARAIGIILTGMGRDGATGLLRLREAGAMTIAQDEASSTVHGMPSAAVALGAVERALPLTAIAPAVSDLLAPTATGSDRPTKRG